MTAPLRRLRTCQVRRSSRLDSKVCGHTAVEKREDNALWVCMFHRLWGQTHATDPGVLPADRGERRRAPFTHSDLLGAPIIVQNPQTGDRWEGIGLAYSEEPCILIEQQGVHGQRLMLPLAWARPRP